MDQLVWTGDPGDAHITALAQAADMQMPFIEPLRGFDVVSTAAPTANKAFGVRFRVAKAITITKMAYYVSTASGNIDLGIYSWDGTTLTRVASTGSTAAAGTNVVQEIALTGSVVLQPGIDYFLFFAADNATITVARHSFATTASYNSKVLGKTTSFPLPATIATPTTTETFTPWLSASGTAVV